MEVKYILDKYLNNRNERSTLLIKNIFASFLIKGWSLIVQILLVPLSLNCLTTYEYGIWLTLSSILAWMDTFDIGLGNGLRNKLAEAIASNDIKKSKIYISTTFISLFLIALVVCVIVNVLIYNINIYTLFNVNKDIVPNLPLISMLLVVMVSMTFVAKGINSFYLALQLPAITNLMQSLASTLALIGIGSMAFFHVHSLLWVSLVFALMPLIVFMGFCFYAFNYAYKNLCPSFRNFERCQIKPLMSLSLKFFMGQIAGIILMLTANFIISNTLSPEYVTPYQVSYRYYSLLLIPFTLITTPIWSATTDAYTRNDISWINKTLKTMEKITVGGLCILVIMFLVSDFAFALWVGNKVYIDFYVSLLMAIYIGIFISGLNYSNIIYGIGNINLTVATVLIMAVIFLLLAKPFTIKYGVSGLISLQIMAELVCTIQKKIQCHYLLKK